MAFIVDIFSWMWTFKGMQYWRKITTCDWWLFYIHSLYNVSKILQAIRHIIPRALISRVSTGGMISTSLSNYKCTHIDLQVPLGCGLQTCSNPAVCGPITPNMYHCVNKQDRPGNVKCKCYSSSGTFRWLSTSLRWLQYVSHKVTVVLH